MIDPPNNLDRLHAALCHPVELRKSYLSNPPDDEKREQDHAIEQQTQRPEPPEPLPPGRGWISQPQQHPQTRDNGSFIFGVPTPLRARTPLA